MWLANRASAMRIIFLLFVLLFPSLPCMAHRPSYVSNQIEPARMLLGHTDGVTALEFFPDNVRIASAGHDKTVRIWDASNGKLIRVLEGHRDAVYAVSVSADGKWVASGSGDHLVIVWDAQAGEQIAQLEGHTGAVHGVKFLPDGTLLSGGGDGLRRWDVKNEKLIWKSAGEVGVACMSVSKDGKRCAFGTDWDGTIHVWDLQDKKLIRTFDSSGFVAPAVGISPDGKTVVAPAPGENLEDRAWDVESGKMLAPHFGRLQIFNSSPDGQYVLAGGGPNCNVLSAADWEVEYQLDPNAHNQGNQEFMHCAATSPDCQWFAVGGGGYQDGNRWVRGRINLIAIFAKPDETIRPDQGAPRGNLSWEIIPAAVKTRGGKTIPLAQYHLGFGDSPSVCKAFKLKDGLDVVQGGNALLLHRDAGNLDELLTNANNDLCGLAWDGEHLWVGITGKGVLVLDLSGNVVATVASEQGLPGGRQMHFLHTLSSGKVMIGGFPVLPAGTAAPPHYQPESGWCAVAHLTGPESPKVEVRMIFSSAHPPPGLAQPFLPNWFGEPPADAVQHRQIWVGCGGAGGLSYQVVRIDADTLAMTPYQVAATPVDPAHPPAVLGLDDPPVWLDRERILASFGDPRILTIGKEFVDNASARVLLHEEANRPLTWIRYDGKIVLASPTWRALDPQTLSLQELGPGFRINGFVIREGIRYFISGSLGLAGFRPFDGIFVRFSLDPAHRLPLFVGSTPPGLRPVPAAGVIEYEGKDVTFVCGRTGIAFQSGKIWPYYNSAYWFIPDAHDMRNRDAISGSINRALNSDTERARLGFDAARTRQIAGFIRDYREPQPDQAALLKMFAQFQAAPQGPAQQTAAKAIFTAVQALGEERAIHGAMYLSHLRSMFTAAQWTLVTPAEN